MVTERGILQQKKMNLLTSCLLKNKTYSNWSKMKMESRNGSRNHSFNSAYSWLKNKHSISVEMDENCII